MNRTKVVVGDPYLERLVMSADAELRVRRWALREWVRRSSLRWHLTLDYLFYEFGCDTLSHMKFVRRTELDRGLRDAMNYLIAADDQRIAASGEYRRRRTTAKRSGAWSQGKIEPQPGFAPFANFDKHFVVVASSTIAPWLAAPTDELFVDVRSPTRCSADSQWPVAGPEIDWAGAHMQASTVWLFLLDRVVFDAYATSNEGRVTYPGPPAVTDEQVRRYSHLLYPRPVRVPQPIDRQLADPVT